MHKRHFNVMPFAYKTKRFIPVSGAFPNAFEFLTYSGERDLLLFPDGQH